MTRTEAWATDVLRRSHRMSHGQHIGRQPSCQRPADMLAIWLQPGAMHVHVTRVQHVCKPLGSQTCCYTGLQTQLLQRAAFTTCLFGKFAIDGTRGTYGHPPSWQPHGPVP
jgi:hypothetical protein